jgi:hypothetical protein
MSKANDKSLDGFDILKIETDIRRALEEYGFKFQQEINDNGTTIWLYATRHDIIKVEFVPDADKEILDEVKGK